MRIEVTQILRDDRENTRRRVYSNANVTLESESKVTLRSRYSRISPIVSKTLRHFAYFLKVTLILFRKLTFFENNITQSLV